EDWSGPLTFRSALDGRVINAGAQLYRRFNKQHLVPVAADAVDDNTLQLTVRTCQSNIHVSQAARTRVFQNGQRLNARWQVMAEPACIAQECTLALDAGQTVTLEKVVSFFTSRDATISE